MTETAPAGRFCTSVGELQALLERLQHAPDALRPRVYAECIPLLQEVNGLTKPPLPAREVKALIHEVGWHLRSLAGLASVKSGTAQEHSAWAKSGLDALAQWGVQHPNA